MFENRKDAGIRLARLLDEYRGKDVLVLAVPRGGVEVGYEIARHLHAELGLVVARKLPFPDQPEAGFGAIAEDGSIYMSAHASLLPESTVERVLAVQKEEIKRRVRVLRGDRAAPKIEGRTAILVDDGIAVGSTMRACIAMCKNRGASAIVVAVPVAGSDAVARIGALVDSIVVLETPADFRAVAQVYRDWCDVPDEEVLGIMREYETER